MAERNSHCSWCGGVFAPDQGWPRACPACGKKSYLNPRPVAVMLVPVDDGVLLVRRDIEPRRGELALPGGYIDLGETWQEAGAREVFEETGLRIDPAGIRDFGALTDAEGGFVLIFGVAAPQDSAALAAFTPNSETQECTLAHGPQDLAFPLHTEMLRRYFAGLG